MRFRIPLVVFLFMCLVLSPSSYVSAWNATTNTDPDRNEQGSIDNPARIKVGESLIQEPQPTPPPSEVTTEADAKANPRVFLPAIFGSKQSPTLPPTAQPNYFVSTTGSDLNPGTYNKPWRTIQKAANSLTAGDTVKILPGTYYAKFSPVNSGNADAYITYTADPGSVILDGSGVSLSGDLKGDGLVQIQGKSYIKVQNLTVRNASVNCVNISDDSSGKGSNYIEISALTIQNCNKVGIRARRTDHLLLKDNLINHINYSSGIGVWWSTNVSVDHNTITNAHYYHECQGAYDEALTISWVNHFEIMNNTLDNTEANPSGFCDYSEKLGIDVKESSQNGLVHHNTVRHMTAAGIYVDGWLAGANGTPTLNHIDIYQNLVGDGGGITVGCEQSNGVVEYINIYNNLLLNTSFAGIQVRGAHGDGLRKNINIDNNTIYGALPSGGNGGAGIYVTTSHLGSNNGDAPVIIRNNVSMFYFLSSGGGTVGQILAGNSTIASMITADHNLVFGPQKCSSDYPGCVEVGSRKSADPASVFSNPTAFDLHLTNGSPAIDAGITINRVTDDFDGLPRPQLAGHNYDIGAYEFR
ncbi:MAG: right-handed parallel beta-helix repeat-containing protein [Anaerolineaceae bacterium]|nr:right-handed parallel beta-helix repeat-containing protein [Anaerolineaceae bacterium]